MVFLITYDLNNESKNYKGLTQAILALSANRCRFCKSSWLVKTDLKTADEVFAKLRPYLDDDDNCFVVEVKNNKQGWLPEEYLTCISKEIFS